MILLNINGIPLNNFDNEWNQSCFPADSYHVDYLGLVETNINWTNLSLYGKVRHVIKAYWPQTVIRPSSYTATHTASYQPGGTLSIVGNHWARHATTYENSGMGCCSEVRLSGRNNCTCTIITAYHVPNTTIQRAGPHTLYFQQWHHLSRTTNKPPQPRDQLLYDLSKHIAEILTPTMAIIVMMDANKS